MNQIANTETTAVAAAVPEAAPRQLAVVDYAIKSGASPEQLLQMMQLQVQADEHQLRLMAQRRVWDREDAAERAKREYDEALVRFKEACPNVARLKDIAEGPRKGAKHADLDAVVETATKHLSANGLACTWRIVLDDKDWITVEAKLQHKGGHSETVRFSGPPDNSGAKNPIQARKSAVSYLERITMLLVTGLAEKDADDDGNGGADTGNADPLAIILTDLLVQLGGTTTNKEVMALWSSENGKLEKNNALHGRFKAAVEAHRKKLRDAAVARLAAGQVGTNLHGEPA